MRVPVLTLAALALFALAAAVAASPFGSTVAPSSPEAGRPLEPLPSFGFHHVDGGGDGLADGVGTDDHVYLSAGGSVASGDVRILVPGSASGSKVLGSSSDAFRSVQGPIPFGYHDADSSGSPSAGDGYYVDGDGDGSTGAGDVRVTPFGSLAAGTAVRDTDADAARTLAPAPGTFAYYDWPGQTADDGYGWYNAPDMVYLDADGSGTVSAGDVRMTPTDDKPHPSSSTTSTSTSSTSSSSSSPPASNDQAQAPSGGSGVAPGSGDSQLSTTSTSSTSTTTSQSSTSSTTTTTTSTSATASASASETNTASADAVTVSPVEASAEEDPLAGIGFPVSQERLERSEPASRDSPAPVGLLVGLGLLALAGVAGRRR